MATETAVDVVMPQMGVSVSEGTITRWLKQEGEQVEADEPLLEISTDKVDTEVPSPGTGVVQQILVQEGETVEVGTVLAVMGLLGLAVCWRRRSAWQLALLWALSAWLALGASFWTGKVQHLPFQQWWHGVWVSPLMPYTWLMRRSVRRPVSGRMTSCISSSVCRLPFISSSASPARTRATAFPAARAERAAVVPASPPPTTTAPSGVL